MPEKDKLDKPSNLQFADAIVANIPEPDGPSVLLSGVMAGIIAAKVAKRGSKRR